MDIKNGIGPSKVFLPNTGRDQTYLIDFLVDKFPAISRDEWVSRMNDALVFNQEGVPQFSDALYQANTYIYYYRRVQDEELIPFEEQIVYQDEHLLIADKPHFLPVTPGGHYLQETLLVRLRNKTGIQDLSPIHRIDRETAGLVAFSKIPGERDLYQALFRERQVLKVYEAIAPYLDELKDQFPIYYQSRIEESKQFMQMHEVDGEPNSDTTIHLLEVKSSWAKYRLELGSGKKHQLRVHLSALGMPIQYDQIYPELKPHMRQGQDYSKPLQLVARQLSFVDPITGQQRDFHSSFSVSL